MHLRKFKLQNKDSVTFDICIDMYISNIFETFAPPPPNPNAMNSEKAIIKITVDVN